MTELEHAIFIINELEDEWYPKPGKYKSMKKSHFELLSYQKSALSEIRLFLKQRPTTDPTTSLELFMFRMDKKACETTSAKMNYICNIASDVAMDVMDVLRDNNL